MDHYYCPDCSKEPKKAKFCHAYHGLRAFNPDRSPFTGKLRFSKKLTSDERICTSVMELSAVDSSETNKNMSKAAAESHIHNFLREDCAWKFQVSII